MKCKIYLFRHGQSYHNRNAIFSGTLDSKLTKTGREHAKIIALALKDKRIEAAFHSSLSRSKETLKEVLKFHPECKIVIEDDRLIERSYGKIQGMSHYAFVKKYGFKKYKQIHRGYDVRPPGGESIKDVEKRVLDFIKDLLKFMRENKVNVAISASGNSIRPFRRFFEKTSIKEMMSWEIPYDNYFEYSVKV
ncbi:MAG: histidine phosphatase family protein [Candidatus Pacearchaeota archaeon]|nr:histidine phosphatase family protein [Candidatus Pacearchaeota archaeon]